MPQNRPRPRRAQRTSALRGVALATALCLTGGLLAAGPATISASVGATTSCPGDDADSLLSRADAAMYAAKRSGGARSVLSDSQHT